MARPIKQRARKGREMVSPFRNRIWDLLEKEAEGMNGADVVSALRHAGEEMRAGPHAVDSAFARKAPRDISQRVGRMILAQASRLSERLAIFPKTPRSHSTRLRKSSPQ